MGLPGPYRAFPLKLTIVRYVTGYTRYGDMEIHLGNATPSCSPVLGQGLSQVKRWAGGFTLYIIISLSELDHNNSCCKKSYIK